MRLRHTCETPNVQRLLSAVLTVNSAPFRGYPAETLILRGVDCTDGSSGKRTVGFHVERCYDCDPYGRTDFNAIPELAAAVVVRSTPSEAFAAGLEQANAALERFTESAREAVADEPCPETTHPKGIRGRLIEVDLFPPRPAPCPDCRGTGSYAGLVTVETCKRCGGRGTT